MLHIYQYFLKINVSVCQFRVPCPCIYYLGHHNKCGRYQSITAATITTTELSLPHLTYVTTIIITYITHDGNNRSSVMVANRLLTVH